MPVNQNTSTSLSDVRTKNGFSFSVQRLILSVAASLLCLTLSHRYMRDFFAHYKGTASPAGFVPKAGDLVSAKFSDGAWYRAKICRASPVKREEEVTFIEYGNQVIIGFSDIRPLDLEFRRYTTLAPHTRLNAARKFEVVRALWTHAHSVLPARALAGSLSEVSLSWPVEKEVELVWETDMPHDARTQCAMLSAEVLVRTNAAAGCASAPTHVYVFWGTRGASRPWNWNWTMDVRVRV